MSHPKLLEKIQNYSIRDKIYIIFENYLPNRKQQVKIDATISQSQKVTFGVPQGTLLGPLLFTFYIDSIFQV